MDVELAEYQARKILGSKMGPAPTVGQRGQGCWFFTPDHTQPLPAGSPAWFVDDNGQCSSVGARPPFSR